MFNFHINPWACMVLAVMLAAALAVFFVLNTGQHKVGRKIFLIYAAVAFGCFALLGLLGYCKVKNAFPFFMMLQSLLLIFGICHCTALYLLNAVSLRMSFWREFVFTVVLGVLGMATFYLIFGFTSKSPFTLYFLSAFFFFFMPFFILKSFDFLIAIPELEYPAFYPVEKKFDEVSEADIDDRFMIILKYRMERSEGSNDYFTSTYKSPLRAIFGEHFSRFLHDFNDTFPGKQIYFHDQYGGLAAWNFYVKPRRWYQMPRYIDPALTINENDLKESDTIICERINK